jgi:1-acyl-sn-glycerol-3-phosphate acyltransferase
VNTPAPLNVQEPNAAQAVEQRDKAPCAADIERWLRSGRVLTLRPVVWAGVGVLSLVRRFSWSAHFECDLMGLKGPLIFAANHRSHVDTAAILDTMPPRICKKTVVAAALDVFGRDTARGWRRRLSKDALQLITAAGFHAFAFDRHGPPLRSVRTSTQLIRRGWHMLLYPEGTRSRDGQMGPFKAGVGVLAKFSGRPVIPVHVQGGERVQPYSQFLPGKGHVSVRYGEPMVIQPNEHHDAFAQRLEEQVRQLGARQAQSRAAANAVTIALLPAPAIARKQPA